jgi:hypothetical protein
MAAAGESGPIAFPLGDRHAEIAGPVVEGAGAATRLDRRRQTGFSGISRQSGRRRRMAKGSK